MATYTVNLFTTLDGFGTGPVAYWGKDGPELREWHARTFFGGANQILVLGANTYRMMAHFAAQLQDDPNFASLSAAPKNDISAVADHFVLVLTTVTCLMPDPGGRLSDSRPPDTHFQRTPAPRLPRGVLRRRESPGALPG
jgi:hypothetical protein